MLPAVAIIRAEARSAGRTGDGSSPRRFFGGLRTGQVVRLPAITEELHMAVELNHTIVRAHDKQASAEFLAHIMGLEVGAPFGPFVPVATSNGVTLDFAESESGPLTSQHYAFLVSEQEFDAIFARIEQAGVGYYADPSHRRPGAINRNDGGPGLYFSDPNGHNFEILTRPYGSGG